MYAGSSGVRPGDVPHEESRHIVACARQLQRSTWHSVFHQVRGAGATMDGRGHCYRVDDETHTQSQVPDGLLVDLRGLRATRHPHPYKRILKPTSLATCAPGLRLPRSASSEPLTSTRFRPGLKASYPVVFRGSPAALNSTYAQKLHFSPRLQPGTKNEQWRIRILWTWCHQWPKRARRRRCSASASTPCRYSC